MRRLGDKLRQSKKRQSDADFDEQQAAKKRVSIPIRSQRSETSHVESHHGQGPDFPIANRDSSPTEDNVESSEDHRIGHDASAATDEPGSANLWERAYFALRDREPGLI